MDSTNNKGQIIIEVSLVLFYVLLVFFAALGNIGKLKKNNQRYQFTQEVRNGKINHKN
jgi:uncharacterized protein (UPF0333 family)